MSANSHCLRVFVRLSDDKFGTDEEFDELHKWMDDFNSCLAESAAGEFDGNEIGGGYLQWFFYGPDIELLFSTLLPIFLKISLRPGSYAIKRCGPPGAREQIIRMDTLQAVLH